MSKCVYINGDGFCTEPDSNCWGAMCCKCNNFKPEAEIVEAAVIPAPAPNGQFEKEAAYRLSRQYRKATAAFGAALEQVVCFGAMLTEWESYIGGNGKKGDGLKAWLNEKCPEINYNTAMGYKALGQKAAALIGGGAQALAVLNGRDTVKAPGADAETPVDPGIVEKKDALFHEATSRRKLEQLYFQFVGRDRPAKGKNDAQPLPKMKRTDEAKAIWNGVMQLVSRTSVRDAIPLLDASATKACYDGLKDLVAALRDHISEFEAGE